MVPELEDDSAFHMVDDNGDDAGINPNLEIYVNENASVLPLFKQAAYDPTNNWHYYKDYFVNLPATEAATGDRENYGVVQTW